MNDDEILAKPIIVVGSARSGTTVMGRILRVHSTLFEIEEPRLTWRYGNDRKSDMLRADDATPEIIAYIRKKFADQVRQSGRVRLLEKTPSNSLRLGFVERVFPDCKIIHTIRNGIDSSLSIRNYWDQAAHGVKGGSPGKLLSRVRELQLRRFPHYAMEAFRRFAPKPLRKLTGSNVWGPRIPGIREMLKELELLEVCALQWRTCVEAACHHGMTMPADRYREVRLEELTSEKLRELLEYAELDEEPAIFENFQQIFDPTRSTGRRSKISGEEMELLDRWITSTMQRLEYPTTLLVK